MLTPDRTASPTGTPSGLSKPFIHPTISRLRSYTPRASLQPSNGSLGSFHSPQFDGVSPSPSHFSEISRSSSPFNLTAVSSQNRDIHSPNDHYTQSEREVFRWTNLRNIGHHIFAKTSLKASTVLGSLALGSPMVLAANGLVCVGTDSGRIFVFDFKQTLKCICGNDGIGMLILPNSAFLY